jgi:vanillate O-demethylase monooxygenase subunit
VTAVDQAPARRNELDAAGEARLYAMLRHFWHPVAWSDELEDRPLPATLCGEKLVLARLADEACAFDDLCAHRGSALSLGTVVDGELRCPYHGWQYDTSGRCTLAPQRPDLSRQLRARVRRYPTEERFGMVWVSLVDQPHFPLPEFPEFDDPAFMKVPMPSSEWVCSPFRRLENYVDLGHFAILHDGLLGDANHPEVWKHSVWRDGRCLRMRLDEPKLEPVKTDKNASLRLPDDVEFIEVVNEWHLSMPLTVHVEQDMGYGLRHCLFFHATPQGPRSVRNFSIHTRNFGADTPEEAATTARQMIEFNNLVFSQDQPVVESQRPEDLPEDLSEELHLKGVDTLSVTYRRWLKELADELEVPPPGTTNGPVLRH